MNTHPSMAACMCVCVCVGGWVGVGGCGWVSVGGWVGGCKQEEMVRNRGKNLAGGGPFFRSPKGERPFGHPRSYVLAFVEEKKGKKRKKTWLGDGPKVRDPLVNRVAMISGSSVGERSGGGRGRGESA